MASSRKTPNLCERDTRQLWGTNLIHPLARDVKDILLTRKRQLTSGISYSSRKAWQSVEFHLIKCAKRLKGQICKKSPFFRVLWDFPCYVQCLYSLPYENIVFNDKVCWLLKFFQDQSSRCRCSIAFFF
jgi:predicted AAA+ superfamily ATPase